MAVNKIYFHKIFKSFKDKIRATYNLVYNITRSTLEKE